MEICIKLTIGRRKVKHSFVVLLVVVLGACAPKAPQECQLPANGFSESDLIGTWSGFDLRGDNTIMIRGDGRYKQIMNVNRTGFRYESEKVCSQYVEHHHLFHAGLAWFPSQNHLTRSVARHSC